MNSPEPIPWRGFRAFDKVIFIVVPLAAIVIGVLPLLDPLLFRRMERMFGGQPYVAWLASGGAWVIAAALLAVLAVYVLVRRQQLVSNRALWFGSGCPACGEHELVRVTRNFSDRFYNLAAVPAYRYACRNCTWRGLRIGRREHSADREAALEAALLRFDPDAPLMEAPPAEAVVPPGDTMLAEAAPRDDAPLEATPLDEEPGALDADEAIVYANGADGAEDEAEIEPAEAEEPAEEPAEDWIWRRAGDVE